MSNEAFVALEQYYPALIAEMPNEFDSHQFILHLARRHQGLYAQALAAFAGADYPFQIVHGYIAHRLLNHSELVTKVGERPSRDIFGDLNSAVLWRKTS